MNIDLLRNFLLACGIINYALLIVWALLTCLAHDWFFRWVHQWYHLSLEQFDGLNYGGILFYKLCILLFNLIPFVALLIVH